MRLDGLGRRRKLETYAQIILGLARLMIRGWKSTAMFPDLEGNHGWHCTLQLSYTKDQLDSVTWQLSILPWKYQLQRLRASRDDASPAWQHWPPCTIGSPLRYPDPPGFAVEIFRVIHIGSSRVSDVDVIDHFRGWFCLLCLFHWITVTIVIAFHLVCTAMAFQTLITLWASNEHSVTTT
jgi:hypothetical protein